jgi:prevent-host-death family protein
MVKKDETAVGVATFKAKCLTLIDAVAQGKTSKVLLLKRNRPVAAIVPAAEETRVLWGAMAGTVKFVAGTDLARGTGEVWEADV